MLRLAVFAILKSPLFELQYNIKDIMLPARRNFCAVMDAARSRSTRFMVLRAMPAPRDRRASAGV